MRGRHGLCATRIGDETEDGDRRDGELGEDRLPRRVKAQPLDLWHSSQGLADPAGFLQRRHALAHKHHGKDGDQDRAEAEELADRQARSQSQQRECDDGQDGQAQAQPSPARIAELSCSFHIAA